MYINDNLIVAFLKQFAIHKNIDGNTYTTDGSTVRAEIGY